MSPDVLLMSLSALAIAYTYVLYPTLLLLKRGELRQQPDVPGPRSPMVSVIIPFHDEERWVTTKLDDTLAWEYPRDRIEIVAVSDGSTDRTNEFLSRYQAMVRVIILPRRQGKAAALNSGIAAARGQVLVLTDANVLVRPQALLAMLAHFRDPRVGAVCGNVTLRADGHREPLGEGLYMRYERGLYRLESRCHTMVGLDGAFCSLRKDLFRPPPADTIADDFAIALSVVSQENRIVYEPSAQGVEAVLPDVNVEFARKARMIAGGYQTLWRQGRELLRKPRPFVLFALVSHKLMRWLVPVFLVGLFTSSLAVAHSHPTWSGLVAWQALFYFFALIGWIHRRLRQLPLVYLPYYFCAVNVAALVGLWRSLTGAQRAIWHKTPRASVP